MATVGMADWVIYDPSHETTKVRNCRYMLCGRRRLCLITTMLVFVSKELGDRVSLSKLANLV